MIFVVLVLHRTYELGSRPSAKSALRALSSLRKSLSLTLRVLSHAMGVAPLSPSYWEVAGDN